MLRSLEYCADHRVQAYEDDPAPVATKRRRGEPEFAHGLDDRGRPIIPGERRSARMTARDATPDDDNDDNIGNGNGNGHSEPTGSEVESSVQTPAANGDTASVSNEAKSTTEAHEID